LRVRIAASFAMIVVVHDNYVDSDYCRQEVAHFKALFGDAGLRERLYVVAMSEGAILRLTATAAWQQLSPTAELVWMPFFQPEDVDMPMDVYSDRGIVASAFWKQFVKLREELVAKIKADAEQQHARVAAPPAAAAAPIDDREAVRIYIESNPGESLHWEAVGKQLVSAWDARVVVGLSLAPPLYVRPTGLPIDRLDDFPLDDADGVVLLWGQKTLDSLDAQILKVESRLPQLDAPPGIVLRPIPAQGEFEHAVSARNWPVVRFNRLPEQGLDVLAQDAVRFELFLKQVLARKKLRQAAARAVPQLATAS
ncbi:MAG: hypothetical protein H7Y61_09745, partial [Rhizobiales bacterium]|nr:hypothetical protein [Rhizobacter sp.]